ncbi:MAG: redoxin domain-containing protein [Nitrososphaerales archaeon]
MDTRRDKVLSLKLPHSSGKTTTISELMGEKGLLLIFYRGSFCPYCAGQLAAVNEYTIRLKGSGVNVAAVSVDSLAEAEHFLNN